MCILQFFIFIRNVLVCFWHFYFFLGFKNLCDKFMEGSLCRDSFMAETSKFVTNKVKQLKKESTASEKERRARIEKRRKRRLSKVAMFGRGHGTYSHNSIKKIKTIALATPFYISIRNVLIVFVFFFILIHFYISKVCWLTKEMAFCVAIRSRWK